MGSSQKKFLGLCPTWVREGRRSGVLNLQKWVLKSLFSALKTTYSCQKVTLLSPNYTKEGGGGGRGVTDLGHTSIFLFTASLIKNLFGLSRGPQPQSPSLGQVGNKVLSAKGEIILNYWSILLSKLICIDLFGGIVLNKNLFGLSGGPFVLMAGWLATKFYQRRGTLARAQPT